MTRELPEAGSTQTFRDTKDRLWFVPCEAPDLRRIYLGTDVDLTRLLDPKFQHPDCFENLEKLLLMIWFAVEPRAMQLGITERDFALSIKSEEVIEQAAQALIRGVIEFYPPFQRAKLRAMYRKAFPISG